MKKINIVKFIKLLNQSEDYIQVIYSQGSCYKFHVLLKSIWSGCKAYINKDKNHIITELNGVYYDISGVVSKWGYDLLKGDDLNLVKSWSFSKQKTLSLKDCPYCHNPITI